MVDEKIAVEPKKGLSSGLRKADKRTRDERRMRRRRKIILWQQKRAMITGRLMMMH